MSGIQHFLTTAFGSNMYLCKIKKSATIIAIQVCILCSCSTGVHHNTRSEVNTASTTDTTTHNDEPIRLQQDIIDNELCLEIKQHLSESRNNTVFVHPGLLFPIPWGMQRARDSGQRIVDKALASSMLEVRSRNSEAMSKRMVSESGKHYFGVHYSMGGAPYVIKAALKAANEASKQLKHRVTYSAILVEPYQFSFLTDAINLDDPHLDQVVVVLSSKNSIFRPDISNASKKILTHNKFHFIYAEEINMKWNHFTFLTQVRSDGIKMDKQARQAKELFDSIAVALASRFDSNQINNMIDHLKTKYATPGGHQINSNWNIANDSASCIL
ncbi:MAG: hypothetical protein GY814_03760 [Gammaproteobacteria bacterium]|nr:hypothetical protein [Gammaproteobacteria bacterium]